MLYQYQIEILINQSEERKFHLVNFTLIDQIQSESETDTDITLCQTRIINILIYCTQQD